MLRNRNTAQYVVWSISFYFSPLPYGDGISCNMCPHAPSPPTCCWFPYSRQYIHTSSTACEGGGVAAKWAHYYIIFLSVFQDPSFVMGRNWQWGWPVRWYQVMRLIAGQNEAGHEVNNLSIEGSHQEGVDLSRRIMRWMSVRWREIWCGWRVSRRQLRYGWSVSWKQVKGGQRVRLRQIWYWWYVTWKQVIRWITCQMEADMIWMTCHMEAGHKVVKRVRWRQIWNGWPVTWKQVIRWTTCQMEADMIWMTCHMETGHKVDNVSDGGRYYMNDQSYGSRS